MKNLVKLSKTLKAGFLFVVTGCAKDYYSTSIGEYSICIYDMRNVLFLISCVLAG